MNIIKVGNRSIGQKDTCFIIAEAGVNHNGSLERAKELIVKAAKAGADAIKFQLYKAEKLVTKTAPRFWDWKGEVKKQGTQYDSYSLLDTLPLDNYKEIIKCCEENNIVFTATPFDDESADFLNNLGMEIFKVASCDVTNIPFLKHIASKDKPIILSTGTASIGEIQEALDAIYSKGNKQVVLLHCILCYPTDFKDVNLRMMQTMMHVFEDIPIGLSDHSLGTTIPLAAVALGAKVVEKHYTIDKKLMVSADHWLSVDDSELAKMVESKNHILSAMGSPKKEKIACEDLTFKYARRSLVSLKPIPKGTKITKEMLGVKRPGTGVPPKYFDLIIGKVAQREIQDDSVIFWEDILSEK